MKLKFGKPQNTSLIPSIYKKGVHQTHFDHIHIQNWIEKKNSSILKNCFSRETLENFSQILDAFSQNKSSWM